MIMIYYPTLLSILVEVNVIKLTRITFVTTVGCSHNGHGNLSPYLSRGRRRWRGQTCHWFGW